MTTPLPRLRRTFHPLPLHHRDHQHHATTTNATVTTTSATAAAFPAAAAAVASCGWQNGHHRRGGAYKSSDLLPIFPCMVGLSAAKLPLWWRSDDGIATTAAPCGVGLWRRNPYGCLAELSRLTPPLWRRPSRLWPQQPPQPHHGGVGLVVVIPHLLN
uniref:Uncharacterized protein n=1 Tax=Tanacetum cinerariifolium TaxID=118510 RepID=A0A6L2LAJ7_TANCI|nr:hypothetical protein [Tanacetum cinerariifolium]